MLRELDALLDKSFEHLTSEYSKLQAGRAKPELIEDIFVSVYGSTMPIKNVASVTVVDQRTLSIVPFDRTTNSDISRAISIANIWLSPQDRGDNILIVVPMMTEENRRNLVKISATMAEDAKVAVRSIRSDFHKEIQKSKTDKIFSEDIIKWYEEDLQEAVQIVNKKIDELAGKKEEEIMKI